MKAIILSLACLTILASGVIRSFRQGSAPYQEPTYNEYKGEPPTKVLSTWCKVTPGSNGHDTNLCGFSLQFDNSGKWDAFAVTWTFTWADGKKTSWISMGNRGTLHTLYKPKEIVNMEDVAVQRREKDAERNLGKDITITQWEATLGAAAQPDGTVWRGPSAGAVKHLIWFMRNTPAEQAKPGS